MPTDVRRSVRSTADGSTRRRRRPASSDPADPRFGPGRRPEIESGLTARSPLSAFYERLETEIRAIQSIWRKFSPDMMEFQPPRLHHTCPIPSYIRPSRRVDRA